MWLLPAVITLLMWSGSDLFSKIGCADKQDREAPLKMVCAVGLVMGLHALYNLAVGAVRLTPADILRYLPVALLYISSMAIGYLGLRYIELSISSPLCNASGSVVLLIYLLQGERPDTWSSVALLLVIFGVLYLGWVESHENPEIRRERQAAGAYRYEQSWLAIFLPVLYMLIDAAGTYYDSKLLETMPEQTANTAYEVIFAVCGCLVFIYLLARGRWQRQPRQDGAKLLGAVCETVGQIAYVYALAANAPVAAPVISAYCVLSVVWSRLFLQEKLSWKHYLAISATISGIIILGILEAGE